MRAITRLQPLDEGDGDGDGSYFLCCINRNACPENNA
jgi:hypothetical protein